MAQDSRLGDVNKCPLTGNPCFKEKNIHIGETFNGVMQTFELCQDCFHVFDKASKSPTPLNNKDSFYDQAKKLVEELFGKFALKKEPVLESIPPILVPLDELPIVEIPIEMEAEPVNMLTCPLCGYTLEDLTHKNRLGCGTCYETFKNQLYPLIQQYHSSFDHRGKYPHHHDENEIKEFFDEYDLTQYTIASLEDKMRDAIAKEAYEDAAILRDTIAGLKIRLSEMHPKTSEDQ